MTPEELNRRYGAEGVRFDAGQGGLTRVTLTTPASEAEIYLHGGHVTRFDKKGEPPVLFLSKQSLFQRDKAIRGGIPLIFPWFGPHPQDAKKQQHGFARTAEWAVVSTDGGEGQARLILRIESDDETRALWPHDFVATLIVTADEKLSVGLDIANTGEDGFSFEAALHTYLTVGDVRQVSVTGLENTAYIDKTDGMKRKQQLGAVKIEKETDSVYVNTTAACVVHDPKLGRRIVVEKSGSKSTVVWNPHVAKAKAFSDFGDDEWQQMICVETSNASENAVRIGPEERHVMSAIVRTEKA